MIYETSCMWYNLILYPTLYNYIHSAYKLILIKMKKNDYDNNIYNTYKKLLKPDIVEITEKYFDTKIESIHLYKIFEGELSQYKKLKKLDFIICMPSVVAENGSKKRSINDNGFVLTVARVYHKYEKELSSTINNTLKTKYMEFSNSFFDYSFNTNDYVFIMSKPIKIRPVCEINKENGYSSMLYNKMYITIVFSEEDISMCNKS